MNKSNVERMVGTALLMALIIVLQLIPIPPVGGFPISLVLIPIVMGASMYGPATGALLGAAFGIVVFINCVTGADPGGAMVFHANAVLCFVVVVAKGTLAGLASGFVYKLVKRWNPYIAMLCAAIVCPLVNTGVFVACMLLFFVDVLSAWAAGADLVGYILTGLILANFVPELIINVVFSPAGQRIIHMFKRK